MLRGVIKELVNEVVSILVKTTLLVHMYRLHPESSDHLKSLVMGE